MGIGATPYRRNPYRRGIAMAIMLERSWDRLAAILGDRPAPFDRIVDEGSKQVLKGTPSRLLNLPHPLDDEKLRRLHAERLEAIESLAQIIGPTLGKGEAGSVMALVEESRTIGSSEQYHVVGRRRHLADPWDRERDPDEGAEIARAADAQVDVPPTAIAPDRNERPQVTKHERESIAIDLVVHSLLVKHGVDREALHRELAAIRRTGRDTTRHDLVSPSAQANAGRTLASLGPSFPPARFTLDSRSLDVERIDVIVASGALWRYERRNGRYSMHSTHARSAFAAFDTPGRSLSVVTRDPMWHPNIVVQTATEIGAAQGGGMRLTLSGTRTHIDPPGSPPPVIHTTAEAMNASHPGGRRSSEYAVYDNVPIIRDALRRNGLTGRSSIRHREGTGLVVDLADPGADRFSHVIIYHEDTLADGREAIEERTRLAAANIARRRGRRKAPTLAVRNPDADADVDAPIPTRVQAPSVARKVTPLDIDDAMTSRLQAAERIDVLLADMLRGDCDVEPDPEIHEQLGIMAVSRAMLAPGIEYRLERFDRVMGKVTHAIGVIETTNPMTPGQAEELRDGDVRTLLKRYGQFSRSQVRKVSRDSISTVTIRVPLCDPHGPLSENTRLRS